MAAAKRDDELISALLSDPEALRDHVARELARHCPKLDDPAIGDYHIPQGDVPPDGELSSSSVLFTLTTCSPRPGRPPEVCLILNKRSQNVRQPGDLCCPGGSAIEPLDDWIGALMRLPGWKVFSHPRWTRARRKRPGLIRRVAPSVATALREGWEEMRLNPFRVRFLGALPPHDLSVFRRTIFPVVAWTDQRDGFRANWEVERIIHLPLRRLFDRSRYARFRPALKGRKPAKGGTLKRLAPEYPCFLVGARGQQEILWGVTYRIVMTFLGTAFRFEPPEVEELPLLSDKLPDNYLRDR